MLQTANRWAWVSVPTWRKNTPPWNSTTNESKRVNPRFARAHLKQHRLQRAGHHCTLFAQQNLAEHQKTPARSKQANASLPKPVDAKLRNSVSWSTENWMLQWPAPAHPHLIRSRPHRHCHNLKICDAHHVQHGRRKTGDCNGRYLAMHPLLERGNTPAM